MKTKRLLLLQACIMLFSLSVISQIINPGDTLKINFQPTPGLKPGGSFVGAAIPVGYLGDFGAVFAKHGAFSYGWDADCMATARQRVDPTLPTGLSPYSNNVQFNLAGASNAWKIKLKPGKYQVKLVGGDALNTNCDNSFMLMDGTILVDLTPGQDKLTGAYIPGNPQFDEYNFAITVAADSVFSLTSETLLCNAKVCFIQFSNFVPVTGVTLSPATVAIKPAKTQQLTATFAPANASNTGLTWASSNELFATVSATGLVTAVAPGTANITATTTDGSFIGTSSVTVIDSTNLVLNPGFEDGFTNWAITTPSDAVINTNPLYVFGGNKSVKLGPLAWSEVSQVVNVVAGEIYTLSGVGSQNTTDGTVSRIQVWDVATNNNKYASIDFTVPTPTKNSLEVIFPTTEAVKIFVFTRAGGIATAYFDDIYLGILPAPNAVKTTKEVKTFCYLNSINNQLTVKNNDGVQSLSIFNVNGQILLTKTVNSIESTLNVSNLRNGLYIVKANLQDGKSEFIKVLKK